MKYSNVDLTKNDFPLMTEKNVLSLFYPYVPKKSIRLLNKVLNSRWIGQGPLVDKFETLFKQKFSIKGEVLSVGSGTDALHLAYLLAGIEKDDEVLTPVFTCTATNIPLRYIGAKIKFVDINPKTLNISIEDLKKKISKKTKALVIVDYGGLPNDIDQIKKITDPLAIKIIQDAAQSIGSMYNNKYVGNLADFTIFSFQAIKHITTGDGGMLAFKNKKLLLKAKRLRWFGIDREKKQKGIWENDIYEIGFKYQMTDIGAAMGIAGIESFNNIIKHRKRLFDTYAKNLKEIDQVNIVNDNNPRIIHAAWLFTIICENRIELQKLLASNGVESGQVHYRNDRYSIFKQFAKKERVEGMDSIEKKYLVLPLNMKIKISDVKKVCRLIKAFYEQSI